MPQLRVDDSGLVPGGVIGNSPTANELGQTFKEDDPSMRLPDKGDRYAAGAIVEVLGGIFETAQISGGGRPQHPRRRRRGRPDHRRRRLAQRRRRSPAG